MDGYSSSGEWKELELGSSIGTAKLLANSNTIIFKFSPINKKATITLANGVATTNVAGCEYATSFSQATVGAYCYFIKCQYVLSIKL